MGGPSLGDGFVRCKAVEGLETLGEVVGIQEGSEVFLELLVCGVVISAYGGFLKGSVHALDLAVGPEVIGLAEAMLDAVFETRPVEPMQPVARCWP